VGNVKQDPTSARMNRDDDKWHKDGAGEEWGDNKARRSKKEWQQKARVGSGSRGERDRLVRVNERNRAAKLTNKFAATDEEISHVEKRRSRCVIFSADFCRVFGLPVCLSRVLSCMLATMA
jgi:hypothetical protein